MRLSPLIPLSITALACILPTNKVNADDLDNLTEIASPLNLSLELSSRYIWRGQEYGDAPVMFSTLSYADRGLGIWVMGAYAVNNSHQEVDLGLTYNFSSATFGLSDYYYPSESGSSDNYFDLNNHTTGHWGEAYVTFTPINSIRVTGSCYIYGADKKPNGRQAYSSYAEIAYIHQFDTDNVLTLAAGASLNKGFYTNYNSSFSVVNIDLSYSTAFSFGKFKLPVKGSYIINPYREKSFFRFSAYFNI